MPESNAPRRNLTLILLVAAVAAIAAVAAAALMINISERRQEGQNPFFRVVELTDDTVDPAVWGKNFPLQYDSYKRTVDQVRTRYGGSEAVSRTPSDADPRSIVAQSRLEEDPRLKTFWSGYAFSVDFREERGHAYMLDDQLFTERQNVTQQPGSCLHCHGSMYVPYKKAGNGDIMEGFKKLNPLPYQEARKGVDHPVACIDCHDSQTMQLRITRPGFVEGMRVFKASQGIENYDVRKDATHQEMRTYVCAQCHVEYYFKPPDKQLTYPWHKGQKVEQIIAYYDEVGFKDWQHKESGAPVLKAQHPEFELYSQGIHAKSGVACADCHMPYVRTGAQKVSDHHVRSPVLNIQRACQTCHKWPEEELRERIFTIQDRTYELRNEAMDAVVSLIGDIQKAQAAGATEEQLKTARQMQRYAQFMVDFIEAENSMGFHAPQEAARVLGHAMNIARQGQLAVRDPQYQPDLPWTKGAGPEARPGHPAPPAAPQTPEGGKRTEAPGNNGAGAPAGSK